MRQLSRHLRFEPRPLRDSNCGGVSCSPSGMTTTPRSRSSRPRSSPHISATCCCSGDAAACSPSSWCRCRRRCCCCCCCWSWWYLPPLPSCCTALGPAASGPDRLSDAAAVAPCAADRLLPAAAARAAATACMATPAPPHNTAVPGAPVGFMLPTPSRARAAAVLLTAAPPGVTMSGRILLLGFAEGLCLPAAGVPLWASLWLSAAAAAARTGTMAGRSLAPRVFMMSPPSSSLSVSHLLLSCDQLTAPGTSSGASGSWNRAVGSGTTSTAVAAR